MAKARKVKKVSPDDECTLAAVRILRVRLKEFYSHWRDPDQMPTPAQLHDLRISGKRLRYSADSLRELYPDRLTLLIDLLKRLQDVLGEIQDCETHRIVVETDLARRTRRHADQHEITALRHLCEHYEQRQAKLFVECTALWQGISNHQFHASLKDLISHPIKATHESQEPLTHD